MKVTKPVTKKDIIDYFKADNPWELHKMAESINLESFLNEEGVTSLERYIDIMYEPEEGESWIPIKINYIKKYFSMFKHREISVDSLSDSSVGIDVKGFSKMDIWEYDGDMYAYFYN
jgi:hypothetical protein